MGGLHTETEVEFIYTYTFTYYINVQYFYLGSDINLFIVCS